jgi:hypothetical protein
MQREPEVPTSTAAGMAFEWRQCPDHPFLGVSVAVAAAGAVCIRPLDGPNHPVDIRRTKPVPWAPHQAVR